MKEFLTKLNIVKNNNYINKLKQENTKKENRIEKYVTNFKKVITEMELEKEKTSRQLRS